MAKKQRTPKITIPTLDELKNSGKYNDILAGLNRDPEQSYKLLTVMEETDNSITRANNGTLFLQALLDDMNVSDERRIEILTPMRIPVEVREKLKNVDLEKVYKKTYNEYTYNKDMSIREKLLTRDLMSYAKMKMLEDGKNPAELLQKRGAVGKVLKFFGNVLNMDAQTVFNIALPLMARSGSEAAKETLLESQKEIDENSSLWQKGRKVISDFMFKIRPETVAGKVYERGVGEEKAERVEQRIGEITGVDPDMQRKLSAPLQLWDTSLSERYMRNIGEQIRKDDPVLKMAFRKTSKNIPLTTQEQDRIDKFNKRVMWSGIGAEVGISLLMPSGLIKGLDKAIDLAKADNLLDIAQTTAKTVLSEITERGLKNVDNIKPIQQAMNEILEMGSRNADEMVEAITKKELTKAVAKNLKPYNFDLINTNLEIAENSFKSMTNLDGAVKFGGKIGKSKQRLVSTLQKGMNAEKQLAENAITRLTHRQYKKIQTVKNNIKKKFKFRKLYKSEGVGLREALLTRQEKLIARGRITKDMDEAMNIALKGGAKKVMDTARRMGEAETDKVMASMESLAINLRRMYKGVSKEIEIDDFHRIMDDVLEQTEILRKFEIDGFEGVRHYIKNIDDLQMRKVLESLKEHEWQLLVKTRKELDNFLIDEIKHGVKIKAIGLSEEGAAKWNKLSEQFSDLWYEQPNSPVLVRMENELREFLNKTQALEIVDKELVKNMMGNSSYMAHVLTDRGRKFMRDYGVDKTHLAKAMDKAFKAIGSVGGSAKRRKYAGTITEINNYFKSNRMRDEWRNIIKDPKQLEKAVAEIDSFKFFETNIAKIMGIRGQRHATALKQNYFYKMIQKFGSTMKKSGWVQLDESLPSIVKTKGKKILYYPPDVKTAIDNFTMMFRDEGNLFWHMYEKVNRVWKKTTLAFPTTVVRNSIGNVFNSMLSFKLTPKNMAIFVQSTGEAIALWIKNRLPRLIDRLPDYLGVGTALKKFFGKAQIKKIGQGIRISKTGKMVSFKTLFDEAAKRGIFSTGFQKVEATFRELEGKGGKVGKSIKRAGKMTWSVMQGEPLLAVNGAVEEIGRFALFINAVKQGQNFEAASQTVFKYLFDYGDLGRIDKKIKGLLPFWTWTRKNTPLQLAHLFADENRAIIKITNSLQRKRRGDKTYDETFMSGWLSDTPKVIDIKKTKETGKPHFLVLETMFPTFELSKVIRSLSAIEKDPRRWKGFKLNVQPLINELGALLTPIIKKPLENALNINFQFKTPIERAMYQSKEFLGMRLDPKMKNWLGSIRALGTLFRGDANIPKFIKEKTGVQIGMERTMTTPERDVSNAIMGYLLFAPYRYDRGFSKDISSYNFNQKRRAELSSFRTMKRRLLESGRGIKEGDVDDIMKRASWNAKDVIEAYREGLITKKQRDSYIKSIVKIVFEGWL